jgi:hypothetical protein
MMGDAFSLYNGQERNPIPGRKDAILKMVSNSEKALQDLISLNDINLRGTLLFRLGRHEEEAFVVDCCYEFTLNHQTIVVDTEGEYDTSAIVHKKLDLLAANPRLSFSGDCIDPKTGKLYWHGGVQLQAWSDRLTVQVGFSGGRAVEEDLIIALVTASKYRFGAYPTAQSWYADRVLGITSRAILKIARGNQQATSRLLAFQERLLAVYMV